MITGITLRSKVYNIILIAKWQNLFFLGRILATYQLIFQVQDVFILPVWSNFTTKVLYSTVQYSTVQRIHLYLTNRGVTVSNI